jgi:hypothetical protein
VVKEEETDIDVSLHDSSQHIINDDVVAAKIPIESKKSKSLEGINNFNFNKLGCKAINQYIKIEEHTRNAYQT